MTPSQIEFGHCCTHFSLLPIALSLQAQLLDCPVCILGQSAHLDIPTCCVPTHLLLGSVGCSVSMCPTLLFFALFQRANHSLRISLQSPPMSETSVRPPFVHLSCRCSPVRVQNRLF